MYSKLVRLISKCASLFLKLNLPALLLLVAHFADHPIEDLIEKIACQFTAQHI